MLCLKCGVTIGAVAGFCDRCQAQGRLSRQVAPPEPPKASRKSNSKRRFAPPPGATPLELGMLSLLDFFRSPLGIIFVCGMFFTILWISVIIASPETGILAAAFIALVVSGIVCGNACPFLFPFEDTIVTKNVVRGCGFLVSGIGLVLLSVVTGKDIADAYYVVDDLLHKHERRGAEEDIYLGEQGYYPEESLGSYE